MGPVVQFAAFLSICWLIQGVVTHPNEEEDKRLNIKNTSQNEPSSGDFYFDEQKVKDDNVKTGKAIHQSAWSKEDKDQEPRAENEGGAQFSDEFSFKNTLSYLLNMLRELKEEIFGLKEMASPKDTKNLANSQDDSKNKAKQNKMEENNDTKDLTNSQDNSENKVKQNKRKENNDSKNLKNSQNPSEDKVKQNEMGKSNEAPKPDISTKSTEFKKENQKQKSNYITDYYKKNGIQFVDDDLETSSDESDDSSYKPNEGSRMYDISKEEEDPCISECLEIKRQSGRYSSEDEETTVTPMSQTKTPEESNKEFHYTTDKEKNDNLKATKPLKMKPSSFKTFSKKTVNTPSSETGKCMPVSSQSREPGREIPNHKMSSDDEIKDNPKDSDGKTLNIDSSHTTVSYNKNEPNSKTDGQKTSISFGTGTTISPTASGNTDTGNLKKENLDDMNDKHGTNQNQKSDHLDNTNDKKETNQNEKSNNLDNMNGKKEDEKPDNSDDTNDEKGTNKDENLDNMDGKSGINKNETSDNSDGKKEANKYEKPDDSDDMDGKKRTNGNEKSNNMNGKKGKYEKEKSDNSDYMNDKKGTNQNEKSINSDGIQGKNENEKSDHSNDTNGKEGINENENLDNMDVKRAPKENETSGSLDGKKEANENENSDDMDGKKGTNDNENSDNLDRMNGKNVNDQSDDSDNSNDKKVLNDDENLDNMDDKKGANENEPKGSDGKKEANKNEKSDDSDNMEGKKGTNENKKSDSSDNMNDERGNSEKEKSDNMNGQKGTSENEKSDNSNDVNDKKVTNEDEKSDNSDDMHDKKETTENEKSGNSSATNHGKNDTETEKSGGTEKAKTKKLNDVSELDKSLKKNKSNDPNRENNNEEEDDNPPSVLENDHLSPRDSNQKIPNHDIGGFDKLQEEAQKSKERKNKRDGINEALADQGSEEDGDKEDFEASGELIDDETYEDQEGELNTNGKKVNNDEMDPENTGTKLANESQMSQDTEDVKKEKPQEQYNTFLEFFYKHSDNPFFQSLKNQSNNRSQE